MMKFSNHKFMNQEVRLDFISYDHCTFDNCAMVYSGYSPVSVSNSDFRNVPWVLNEAANNTLVFLSALYHSGEGGRQVVEPILRQITADVITPDISGITVAADNNELALGT